MTHPGVLIAFEGIDGSGKTTQTKLLAHRLEASGFDVVMSKEPTNGPWGQKIRQSKTNGRLSPAEELEAFVEDRREHVADLVQPALDRGAVVIIDRYYYSTAAYQGIRGLDAPSLVAQNEEFAPRPDLVVLLDVEPELGVKRIRARGDAPDEFEGLDDLANVRALFRELEGSHVRIFDGSPAIGDVHEAILTAVTTETRLAGRSAEDMRELYRWVAPPNGKASGNDALGRVKAIQDDRSIPPEEKAQAILRDLGVGQG